MKQEEKVLYISDLDGTLLNRNARLSEKTAAIISKLIQKGLLFTIATARSQSSVDIIADLGIQLPAVQLNGVLIYDFAKKQYTGCTPIDTQSAQKVIDILHRFNRMSFVYKFDTDCGINVEFEKLSNQVEKDFFNARKDKDYKSFQKVEQVKVQEEDKIIYFTMVDEYEKLEKIHHEINQISGVHSALYSDNYSDLYFLEVFSSHASKAAGMLRIKRELGVQKVVAFGDNLNDLEMLREADIGIAVEDAVETVRKSADDVIGKSYEDGVALYLQEIFKDGMI